MFSSVGMVNELLQSLRLIPQPIHFLDSDSGAYIKMLLWSLWKGLGWGSILYLALISGIDPELYEAARRMEPAASSRSSMLRSCSSYPPTQ